MTFFTALPTELPRRGGSRIRTGDQWIKCSHQGIRGKVFADKGWRDVAGFEPAGYQM